MKRYLRVPHLPEGRVTTLAIGDRYVPMLQNAFEKKGIEVLSIPRCEALDPRISSHADLLMLHLGEDRFVIRKPSEDYKVPGIFNEVPYYKEESALNLCLIGKYVIVCSKTAYGIPDGFEPIFVRQRYARCSICVVDEHSIITADNGIANAAESAGLNVLRIKPGFFDLPGYDTGFIGGASFKLAKNVLAFTGTLAAHPDKECIEEFLRERFIEPMYLTDKPAFDIGSAVLIREEL